MATPSKQSLDANTPTEVTMRRLSLLLLAALCVLLAGLPASAGHNADLHSANVEHLANRDKAGTNSDLAFWGKLAFAGNYGGFRILDISKPANPKVLTDFPCNGAQGDVSVHEANRRLLLFQSIDTPQTKKECDSQNTQDVAPGDFEGIRIFDVTNPRKPFLVTAVETDCGSHTHTTIPDPANDRAIIYVSSYPLTGIGDECQPPHDKISIVEVPDAAPETAGVLKEQPLHADTLPFGEFRACHDITVFLELQIAAAACLSEGQLWDISDPANPDTIGPGHTHIRNPAISIWHSSTFTWDGAVTLFGDEWGGGSAHGCDGPADTRGNIWFYETVTPGTPIADPLGRYIIPRPQPATETCTMHNFNVVPLEGRYLGVSAAYQGGTSVFDFTDPSAAQEIGFYDAQNSDGAGMADTWSTYWYNNFMYANDINRGQDVFKLLNDRGRQVTALKLDHLNPQTQEAVLTGG
jgi:hypothetical protein